MNAREAAFLAVLQFLKNGKFIQFSLNEWRLNENPTSQDDRLALEIASGTVRMALALDELAMRVSEKNKLNLKIKERALLRTALYQFCFMERVPGYAITSESLKIAKKYCHDYFIKFLNAVLRKLSSQVPLLPEPKSKAELSLYYSFTEFFVEHLVTDYGWSKAVEILKASNVPPIVMARDRFTQEMVIATDAHHLMEMANHPQYYIQNKTPSALIQEAANETKNPKHILDLCASPGGKLLAASDRFPDAYLYANDVTPEKLARLKQNLDKYGIDAHFSLGPGEKFDSPQKFDVVILDVPCSNSGVLNKRPEARWRLSEAELKALEDTQFKLLQHAQTLLKPRGLIWYMSCSILKQENERLVQRVRQEAGLKIVKMKTILPDLKGADGGFLAILSND